MAAWLQADHAPHVIGLLALPPAPLEDRRVRQRRIARRDEPEWLTAGVEVQGLDRQAACMGGG
jgi:hypothetical protein